MKKRLSISEKINGPTRWELLDTIIENVILNYDAESLRSDVIFDVVIRYVAIKITNIELKDAEYIYIKDKIENILFEKN
jgi:hypothetical protein